MACATSTACSSQVIRDGWQEEQPDNWLARHDPWEVGAAREQVEIQLICSYESARAPCARSPARPRASSAVPYDRPVIGYGGKTVNTLRLWAAEHRIISTSRRFSHGDFVGAVAETLEAESLTRVLYPDDSTSLGQGLRFAQEYFLVACSLADLVRRFRRQQQRLDALPEKVAIQLNDTHPALAVARIDAYSAR